MFDLVIRNGTVVDGTGAARQMADVAIDGNTIVAVGHDVGRGHREIDARGLLVTPGWVDVHTHFDGQVTWDPYLSPSCWHGVTTVVMGNCGVGFAPVRPGYQERLINIMEGVEDIPGSALAEGIQWSWESFPEYLSAIAKRALVMDVAAQVPHAALRAYVMEERGERNLDAEPHDIEKMSLLVREAVQAGAVGVSTSRIQAHRAADGSVVPGSFVAAAEMLALADAVQAGGGGVFEIASDIEFQMPANWSDAAEFAWIAEIGKRVGVTATLALVQNRTEPKKWRSILESIEGARAQGASVVAQVAPRPVGLFLGWESSVHIFRNRPAYEEIASLPLAARVERLKDPKVKAAILSQRPSKATFEGLPELTFATMFRLEADDGTLDYEPSPEKSVLALAGRIGRDPSEIVYDIMMENDGTGYVWDAFVNYTDFNLDHVYDLLCSEASMVSLSDAGAHCGAICDVSMPTFLLTFWTRDRTRGPRFTVEQVVAMQARRTAEVYGFKDRGVIAPGMRADINLIDYEKLRLLPPKLVYDLPASGRRYIQRAEGYRATIAGGVVTFEDGESTGALPGRLLRRLPIENGPARAG